MSVFVLAFYWLVERAAIKRVLLRAVPARRARDVNTVWLEVEEKLGGWVRGEVVLMLAIGFAAGIGYFVIGLPNAALLGVIAGLMEVVPMVGPFLAFAPAVLVALAVDPPRAIAVVLYALVIQQIESNVLVPRVMGHTVGVSPLTVLLGILIGSTLAGLPGAFLAVPLAAAIQVIVAHVFQSEDASQVEAHPPSERAAANRPRLRRNRPPLSRSRRYTHGRGRRDARDGVAHAGDASGDGGLGGGPEERDPEARVPGAPARYQRLFLDLKQGQRNGAVV